MARKISKSIKKSKLTRSSSIDKTINEGKDFVKRSDKRLRIQKARKAALVVLPSSKPNTKEIKPKKANKSRKTLVSRPARPARKSAPAPDTIISPSAVVINHPVGSSLPSASLTNPINNQVIEQELHYRLDKNNANIGKLNFSLRWWDPNDLDLHVTCPCGTEISFSNKRCSKCEGELDIDMNVFTNMSLEPVEHVFFKKPKIGLYKFYVKYYSGPKEHLGVKGTDKSKYALSLHEDLNQIFRYEDTVSTEQREIHYDFSK